MKLAALATLLSLLSVPLMTTVPTASASHCGPYPLVDEVECIVLEAAFNVVDFVLCFYNTAPSSWLRTCIVLTADVLA